MVRRRAPRPPRPVIPAKACPVPRYGAGIHVPPSHRGMARVGDRPLPTLVSIAPGEGEV